MTQRKGRRRPNLTLKEKSSIAHEVLVQHKKVKVVAKEYRISCGAVNQLIHKAKKKPKYFKELMSAEEIKEKKFNRVKEVVEAMIEKDDFIDSCDSVM